MFRKLTHVFDDAPIHLCITEMNNYLLMYKKKCANKIIKLINTETGEIIRHDCSLNVPQRYNPDGGIIIEKDIKFIHNDHSVIYNDLSGKIIVYNDKHIYENNLNPNFERIYMFKDKFIVLIYSYKLTFVILNGGSFDVNGSGYIFDNDITLCVDKFLIVKKIESIMVVNITNGNFEEIPGNLFGTSGRNIIVMNELGYYNRRLE